MSLEPKLGTIAREANSELRSMSLRFWVCLVLALPLLFLSLSPPAQATLATPIVFWGGAPFFIRGRSLNMFTLISIGVGSAYLYSLTAPLSLPRVLFISKRRP